MIQKIPRLMTIILMREKEREANVYTHTTNKSLKDKWNYYWIHGMYGCALQVHAEMYSGYIHVHPCK